MTSHLPAGFAHLQVHSHYSLLGGTASLPDLAARAAADGQSALVLTDRNVLYGAVALRRACAAAGLQPIIGLTLDVAPPAFAIGDAGGRPHRLALLATGPDGYRSLCQLASLMQAAPERERFQQGGLPWSRLREHTAGLLAIDAGGRGPLAHFLREGNRPAAVRYLAQLAGIFPERAYLGVELQRPAGAALAAEIDELGRRFGLPPVALQPVYCLEPADRETLRLLAAIQHNCRLDAVPRAELPDAGDPAISLHWLPPEEMAARYAAWPEWLATAASIVKRCQAPALPDGRAIWPALDLPDDQPAGEALAAAAAAGLAGQYGDAPGDPIQARLAAELAAINRHGFAPLFLVVADIVRAAREAGIPVSTRGSVANSLVAYCLGITTVDPIAHDLLFERFLNPARREPPDIDLDFCSRRRDEVLAYVRRRYGADRVALVATINTFQPKSAVRETGKAYGLDEAQIKGLSARLPRDWHPDPRRRERRTVDDLLAELEDETLRGFVRAAYRLVGQPHYLGVHPGGLVITPGPLTDVVPVQWAPKGFLITQFDHLDVDAIGLPKIDLLGIRALTVLADAVELVRQYYQPSFRLGDIPAGDPATGDLLAGAATVGVFQCESTGAQRTLRQLQARTVGDLAVANAFFKPGPATGGMAAAFIRRYRGEEAVSFLHPALAPILGGTQGVLLFQEQVLRVARAIAGLSWAQADRLRRGMSKFRADEMAALQSQFVDGCCRPPPDGPGFTVEQAGQLWEQVLAFAGYGFNQGHATAYADVSYRSAYLKAHWPAAFLAARLANRGGFHHPAIYMAEARRLGIPVRPPHVNESGRAFTLGFEPAAGDQARPVLWLGLGQVRELRRSSVAAIVGGRRDGAYAGLADLLARAPLRTREVEHLIQAGALDGLGSSRAALLAEAARIARSGSARQMALAFMAATAVPPESPAQRLAWERQLLGLPISVLPLDLVEGREPAAPSLMALATGPAHEATIWAYRLPGWTGGPGFFLADESGYAVAQLATGVAPPAWQPVRVHGRWRRDAWGGGWLQADEVKVIA